MDLSGRCNPFDLRELFLNDKGHLVLHVAPNDPLRPFRVSNQPVCLSYGFEVRIFELDMQPHFSLGVGFVQSFQQIFQRVKLLGVCLLDSVGGCVACFRVQHERYVYFLGFYGRKLFK